MNLHITSRGQGQPLVFFHGWGFDHCVWLPLAAVLEQRYCLYLVDLPGFGLSAPMSWSMFKEKLLARLPAKFTLAGWSMGGLFAMRLAVEEPSRITHLISIASSPRFIQEEAWPGVDKTVFTHFLTNLMTNPQQTISEFIQLQLKVKSYNYTNLPKVSNLQAGLQILNDWDLRESLYQFTKPTCFMFGRLDAIVSRQTMPTMQQRYPDFNYVMFAKAAHMPFLSHQTEFVDELEKFLQCNVIL